jgi:murein DD-endopeptidase MepM/ murein hydrolase activator NlpD
MTYRPYPRQRRVSPLALFLVLIVVLAVTAIAKTYKRWEGRPPEVTLNGQIEALGRNPALAVMIQDVGTGLKHVTIRLKQNDQDVVLADEELNKDASKTYDVGKLINDKYKIQEGPGSLSIIATDNSLRNFLRGSRTDITKNFVVDTKPPRLEVLEGQHYINQGGSECVVYRVSDDTATSGVRVGSTLFPGYPVPGASDKGLRFALFALKYDWPADSPMKVVARDAAGNEVTADFWHKVFPKNFRSRDIPLDDSFVQKVVPEILGHAPDIKDQGDPVKTFVEINSNLRRQNHEAIAKLATESPGQFLWNGPFVQLSNSKVESFFADRRTYIYQGKAVDQQDHVGFDLSVVEHNPIEAANDGKVVLADYFGIYGNTVLIDHGAGLITLYGHLSEILVKPGQMVKKKEIVGKSGTTGLAAGDHLHFGMFLHGIPINATEWWDEHWIQDRVLARFGK